MGAVQALRLVSKLGVVQRAGIQAAALATRDGGQSQQGFPFLRLIRRRVKHRRAVACMVAPGQLRKRQVVMQVFQRRQPGQDHIGMARGLVQVNVHADHEIQRGQRLRQARSIRAGQHRVGGDGDKGPHLAGAGSLDLFGQTGDGQLAHHLGRAADSGVVAAGGNALAAAGPADGVGPKGGRLGKHGAARCVQVPGEHIEHIHQPARQRAEFLGAGADARVHRCLGRGGQGAGQVPDGVGADAAARRHRLRREGGHRLPDLGHAGHPVGHRTEAHQLLGKQGVHQGGQQKHIGAGADEMVGVGHGGGFGAARVDHDQPAAARLHGTRLALEVGHGPHAAVAGQRVGADHQQQVGAHDVGQGH